MAATENYLILLAAATRLCGTQTSAGATPKRKLERWLKAERTNYLH